MIGPAFFYKATDQPDSLWTANRTIYVLLTGDILSLVKKCIFIYNIVHSQISFNIIKY